MAVQCGYYGVTPGFYTQERIAGQAFCLPVWIAGFDDQYPVMDSSVNTFQCLVAERFQAKARSSLPAGLSGVTVGQIGIDISAVMAGVGH